MSNKDHLSMSGEAPKSGDSATSGATKDKTRLELEPSTIKNIAVHPAIGVARVGNTPEDWYLAPEVPGGTVNPSRKFRDNEKSILRQTARFQSYATLQSSDVIEITSDKAEITWRVEIANLKAGSYEFNNAMDLPANLILPSKRRNGSVTNSDRPALDIRPAPIAIAGANENGFRYRFVKALLHE